MDTSLCPGGKKALSKFKPLNTDIPLTWTLSMAPLSAHSKKVQLHHMFMNTSEQPGWNNLTQMIIIN